MLLSELFSTFSELGISSQTQGLIIGTAQNKGFRKIGITPVLTINTILQAIKEKIYFLITPQHLFPHPISQIDERILPQLKLILNHNISIYVPHINNVVNNKITEKIIDFLNLEIIDIFKIGNSDDSYQYIGHICRPIENNSLRLETFAENIKKKFTLNYTRFVGKKDQNINRICVITENGFSIDILKEVHNQNCDCCFMGELSYECATLAQILKINLVEASTYSLLLEKMRILSNLLAIEFPRDEVTFINSKDPFLYF